MATGLEKVIIIPVPKKGRTKECSKYWTIALTSHASKVLLKILQARLQQYMNRELLDVQTGFRKGRSNRQHSWITEKAENFSAPILWPPDAKSQLTGKKT